MASEVRSCPWIVFKSLAQIADMKILVHRLQLPVLSFWGHVVRASAQLVPLFIPSAEDVCWVMDAQLEMVGAI